MQINVVRIGRKKSLPLPSSSFVVQSLSLNNFASRCNVLFKKVPRNRLLKQLKNATGEGKKIRTNFCLCGTSLNTHGKEAEYLISGFDCIFSQICPHHEILSRIYKVAK